MADLDKGGLDRALADYRARRRFDRTPEPYGGEAAPASEPVFVVQRHQSRAPHWDLRLEIGGRLVSWAVPKGPSRDPERRRLAVRTEDHPLEYAGFSGVIPAGEYGAGLISPQDRGVWAPLGDPEASLRGGEIKFRLAGERYRGGWMLKRLPDNPKNWLLIKERDAEAEREAEEAAEEQAPEEAAAPADIPGAEPAPLPTRFAPQLPSPVAIVPAGPGWIHEIKYDGYRTLVWIDRGADPVARFVTRRGVDWTARYGPLAAVFAALPCETALIDGEAVVLDDRGASSLALLQDALKSGRPERIAFFAFDLLHLDGWSLVGASQLDRKARLRALLGAPGPASRLQYCDHVAGEDGAALYRRVCELGLEGIVSKRAAARYVEGRSQSWVKTKRQDLGRFAVVGFTEKEKGRLSALILAEAREEGLVYVGRVGSGIAPEQGSALREELGAHRLDRAPLSPAPKLPAANGRPTWIAPGLYAAEVAYRGRSATSDSLLQPSFLKIERLAPAAPAAPLKPKLVTDRALAAIRITHGERHLFDGDEDGPTKLDVALYYARVGDWMLPDLLGRPLALLRCPSGAREACFFQRHAFHGMPQGMAEVGAEAHLVIETVDAFLGLPQFGVVELHPWACRADRLDRPDRLIFDLDPAEGTPWPMLAEAALWLRERLAGLGIETFVRATGGSGLHLVAALRRRYAWESVKSFAEAVARLAAKEAPKLFTTAQRIAARRGRIYLDVGRNARGATAVASYSLRAAPGLPAATPLAWSEVTAAGVDRPCFNFRRLISRLETLASDPWAGLYERAATITREARLEAGAGDE